MSDSLAVYSASSLIHTGAGQLNAVVLTSSSGAPIATFYDNTAGSGTKLLEMYVPTNYPVIIFFTDRFAPIFVTGLYLALAANITATVWSRQL